MSSTTTISPLKQFKAAFPEHRLVYAYSDELKYRLTTPYLGQVYEGIANRLILKKKLALVTELKVWHVGGVLREVALFIRPVPDEEMVTDEVPGEVMEPDWWEGKERE